MFEREAGFGIMRFLIKTKIMTQYFYHVNNSGLQKSSDSSCLLANVGEDKKCDEEQKATQQAGVWGPLLGSLA